MYQSFEKCLQIKIKILVSIQYYYKRWYCIINRMYVNICMIFRIILFMYYYKFDVDFDEYLNVNAEENFRVNFVSFAWMSWIVSF